MGGDLLPKVIQDPAHPTGTGRVRSLAHVLPIAMTGTVRPLVMTGLQPASEQAPIQWYATYVDGPALAERLFVGHLSPFPW